MMNDVYGGDELYLKVVASRRLLNRFGCMFDLHVYGGNEL